MLAPAGNLTVNPTLFPKLPFDTYRDLVPVTLLAQSPNVLVVHPSVPAKNFRELIAYAKANPDKLNFASPGDGSGAHLAGELLKIDAGIKATHVAYKGIAPAVNDLLGGNVQMMFAGISTVLQHVKSGKLIALAIASPRRNPQLPDVPTVAESGLPGFDVTSWYGIVAPRRDAARRSCRSCSATWPRRSGTRTSRPSSRGSGSSRSAIRPKRSTR